MTTALPGQPAAPSGASTPLHEGFGALPLTTLLDVPAPAKINLFLHVVGRRADGYHQLQTVFRFIDLCDRLDFDRTPDGDIGRDGDGVDGLPPAHDLVLRAAHALRQATGTRYGARIRYRKAIPAGGGLGGGSSDAATTLIALNRLWGTGLRRADLQRLALALGADVPVFVFGRAAFAQGVGEVLAPVALPPQVYWVLRPAVSVQTAAVFKAPDLTRDSESVKISVFADWQTQHSGLFGRNDLETVVCRQHPMVARLLAALHGAGLAARMTGSGSCVFAGFSDVRQARMQRNRIISKIHDLPDVVVTGNWLCQGLADHPLRTWVMD
ncbi:4-(cytidine 5'-diphospho)-2-C-methyl-D-erythritol kinase [Castellaniella hirudinis]|uniref:4-(cytidine 5'-diphospho)-2-C-methyl-D-erythritol kinase n=1 Tax=Castellaniella hirudinis TaxID=1144617 RepID=UPI0039C1A486